MIRTYKLFRVTALMTLGGVMAGPAFSQGTGFGNPGGEEKTIRFRAMGMQQIVENVAFLQGPEKVVFSASRSRPTAWMTHRGAGALRFYKSADLVEPVDPLQPPVPVAEFAPGQSGDWLLLFVSVSGGSPGPAFRVLGIPDRPDEIKEGVRLYNLTGQALAVNINDKTVTLSPGEQEQINPDPVNERSMFLKIAAQVNGEWSLVSSTVFAHRPGARITYYIIDDGKRISFKKFTESVVQAEAASL